MIKAILFDLDDTLLDWSGRTQSWDEFNFKHIGYVFSYVHEQLHPLEDLAAFHEVFWQRTLQQWNEAKTTLRAPHVGDLLIETCLEFGVPAERLVLDDLVDAYQWGPIPGVVPFIDVLEVLPRLRQRGLILGLVTNAFQPIRMRARELQAFGLLEYLDERCLVSAADIGYLKPHPHIFRVALQALNLTAEEVIFVGDSREADIAGAQNIGMRAVQRVNEETTKILNAAIVPDAKITNLHQLEALLDSWYPGDNSQPQG
jgi:HAD superfamily hydrolase (TIGR01509 family)